VVVVATWPIVKKDAMNKALVKQIVAKPRMPKPRSTSIGSSGITCRVSKAQSLRLRAFDLRTEAAEAKKLKAAEAKQAKAEKAASKLPKT
jgi:hypothetical protein